MEGVRQIYNPAHGVAQLRLSREGLQEQMSLKTDAELYDILHDHSEDSTPEAVEAAQAEFSNRQPDGSTLANIAKTAEKVLDLEEAPLSWRSLFPRRCFSFLGLLTTFDR